MAAGATASEGNYLAFLSDSSNTDYRWGRPVSTKTFDGYTYNRVLGSDGKYYWVRDGYTIQIVDESERFDQAGQNTVIRTYKDSDWTSEDAKGLIQSFQNVSQSMGITTLNGDTLYSTSTSVYGGAVNTTTTGVSSTQEFYLQGTNSSNAVHLGGNGASLSSRFNWQDVSYDENTKLYSYKGQVVSKNNLYAITYGNTVRVGVFTNADGSLFTGDVYGANNEILMTATDASGNYVSYWGSEIVDPNESIANMTVSDLQDKFDEVDANVKKIQKDDINHIQLGTTTGGGTIGLVTNGGAEIPGGITVTSTGGTGGEDVQITFANQTDPDDESTKSSFSINAGSKVVANDTTGTSKGTLNSISINGESYTLASGGASVTSGSISDTGYINLKQGETDTTGITLGGRLHDYALVSNKDGDKDVPYTVSDNGTVTLTVQDKYNADNKETVTISGIASTDALDAAAAKATTEVIGSDNITVGDPAYDEKDGHAIYKVELNDDLTLGGKDGQNGSVSIKGGEGSISVTTGTGDNASTINIGSGLVSGLTNTTWNAEADYSKSTNAATEAQLQSAVSSITTAVDAAATEVVGSDNITVGEPKYDEEDGHAIYKVELNDDLTLGGKDGQNGSVSIKGSEGSISVTTGTGDDASTITIGSGTITGLTNEITNWSTFVSDDSDAKTSTHAATLAELYELSQHSVFYAMNGDAIDYGTINLANSYSNKSGGTLIYNVAYAVTDANAEGYNGSAAVNVDLLKDYVSSKVEAAAGDLKDTHLLANPVAGSEGVYTVTDDNKINLAVGTGEEGDTPTTVTIEDVASATDLGDVSQLHDDLKAAEGDTTNVVDAINKVDTKVEEVKEDIGDLNYVEGEAGTKGNVVTNGSSVTDAIGALDAAIGTASSDAKKHSSVISGSDNIKVDSSKTNSTGGTEYQVTLSDDLSLKDKDGNETISIKGSEGTISATGNISAGSFTTTGGISIGKNTDGTNVVSGLGNTSWNASADYSGSTQAATEAQLQKATEGAVQYDRKDDGTVNKGSISLGYTNDAGEQQYTTIRNVADGTATHDAVNVGQLQQVENQVINNSMNISMLEGSIHRLDNRIDRVGAGAAALAALHPLDYDPDAKWDFAAGVGNYRSATATAIGAYYRPNEDVMFSVGGSFGGGENMVNAGVSFKLGSGSGHVTTSKAAMARELAAMKETVAQQNAQIEQQAAQIAELTALVQKLAGEAAASETDAEA